MRLLDRVISGARLDALRLPTPTVGALLEAGECHAECLCARSDVRSCSCSCNGYYHGQLVDQEVEGHP